MKELESATMRWIVDEVTSYHKQRHAINKLRSSVVGASTKAMTHLGIMKHKRLGRVCGP